ncbi:hypothetical protein G6F68_013508 [Rhizopus microsporus]|nr:hypothetical protein G6F68_013508 [Rhizopus microsporus]
MGDLVGGQVDGFGAVDAHRTLARSGQAQNGPQRRGAAGAVAAQQRDDFALPYAHIHAVQDVRFPFAVGGAHVGLHHGRVARDFGVRALGQHRAARQHGDGVGNGGHDVHVVFDHQDGAPGAHALDQLRDAVHVFVAHALRGFVQQQQFGLQRQRGRDFQGALAAVGQVARCHVQMGAQADLVQQFLDAVVQAFPRALRPPEAIVHAQLALQGHAHVLAHRQLREHGGYLE